MPKLKPKKRLTRLHEHATAGGTPEPGLVRDCKILGLHSTHDRIYLPAALEQAIGLYENAPVYLNHPKKGEEDEPRRVEDKFGWFEDVRFVPGDGLRGNFRYNTSHPFAKTFEGWLRDNPDQIGFSHNALGRLARGEDGGVVVQEIPEVHSVDLVSRGATTQGLFEGHMGKKCTDDVMEGDELGMPGADAGGMAPVTEEPDMGAGGGGYETHLAEMVKAIMTDSSLDKAAKRKKLLKALDLCDEAPAASEPMEEEAEVGESEESNAEGSGVEKETKDASDEEWTAKADEAATAARKDPTLAPLVEGYTKLKRRQQRRLLEAHCRDLCVEAKLPLTAISDLFVATLVEARTDKARRALIEDRRQFTGAARKPRSQPPRGSTGGKTYTADDILAGITD